jgi:hypothetical protein
LGLGQVKVHGKRSLLNPSGIESTAAIVAEVEDTSWWKPGCDEDGDPLTKWSCEPEAQIRITDCDRAVSLIFAWSTAEQRKAAIVKVDRMVDALLAFRAGLVIEQARYVDRIASIPEKKKS